MNTVSDLLGAWASVGLASCRNRTSLITSDVMVAQDRAVSSCLGQSGGSSAWLVAVLTKTLFSCSWSIGALWEEV